MANYREVELLHSESIATKAIKTIDIRLSDPISRIDVICKKTNSNRVPIAHPSKIIKSIEIIDGSDVLFSMSGSDLQAMTHYQTNLVPGSMLNYEQGQWSMQMFSLFFGRQLWDEVLALDPNKFVNPQIKIDHDLDLGGSTGTVADLSVYAHVFDEKKISPVGFLSTREQYSFLPVANQSEYIELPVDYPIRALMFGASECEDGPEYNIAEFKITEDEGKRVLINSLMERYLFQNARRDNLFMEKLIAKTADTSAFVFYATPHWERSPVIMPVDAHNNIHYTSAAGCKYTVTSETAATLIEGWIMGHCPFGQVFIPFGDLNKVDDVWHTEAKASARITIKAGATPDVDEYVRLYIQQIRGY